MSFSRRFGITFAALLALCFARPAHAVLDIENRGPTLQAGAFAMRVTNIGALGNPYSNVGRSFDPSFEYPRGSGIEGLKSADLWVGARRADGVYRVSGGPLLEWRPTLAADDHVREALGGQLGTQPDVDDDGDGRFDEEALNGLDDDGDGEVDEDMGVSAAQKMYAQYVDDRPEALDYGFSGGEPHEALHLSVQQEAMTWSVPGYDRIAGVRFRVTNHGTETLEDVRIGLFTDLDVSAAGESGGHLNDRVQTLPYVIHYNDGVSSVPSVDVRAYGAELPVQYSKSCIGSISGTASIVSDGVPGSGLPVFGVVPLSHSLDPIAIIRKSQLVDNRLDPYITGPADVSFGTSYFALDLPPGQGGPPVFDADRYRALAGQYPGPPSLDIAHDYAALVSCGPFARMAPGQTLEFELALVCAPSVDSIANTVQLAAITRRGNWISRYADTTASLIGNFQAGKSGFTGHETCYEAPPGLNFRMDPHCYQKYPVDSDGAPPDYSIPMLHGTCTWVDLDCDACTGFNGNETQSHWSDPARVPPSPAYRAVAGDGRVTLEWDNSPEVALRAPTNGATFAPVRFTGYNVYRLSDWKRRGLLPGPESFQMIASFGVDTLQGQAPIATITDDSIDYDIVRFGAKQYPIGRYRFEDRRVNDGFDYLYVVTTVGERTTVVSPALTFIERFESPVLTSLDSLVSPRAEARTAAGQAWVVPNPYRAHAPWERQPVAGDTFGRHVDFMGLPRAACTVRVYTLAGDLVAELPHDGSSGDGQLRWNLISRNGQDIASGVYFFTVDSALGQQRGRFVVIR
ncbi:MAG: hypothetical protein HZA61_14285 [Candidatus Eisenbacteria bacterium]|uniref:T9SS type A sorting domain-containing protein n=1 Tax=Eiseniibacteriota bacterium TaxID=2212470 RepID=A0A933W451_UNCEI|nr:hypothetical protein [Candidatus Eisenbacteria bacterium]